MAITETSICNSALIKCGADIITALTDNNKRAKLCNEQYSKLRDALLMSHLWNFALVRLELTKLSTTPVFEWDVEYLLPADNLRIIKIQDSNDVCTNCVILDNDTGYNAGIPFVIENGKILTDSTDLKIQYIKQVTDTSKYTPAFAEALSRYLAWDICYALTNSATFSERLKMEFTDYLRNVRSFDAQEGTAQDYLFQEFIAARL